MDIQTLLRLGEKVDLRIGKSTYRSAVQDVFSKDSFLVLHPLDRRSLPMHIEHDEYIDVVYFRENGQFLFTTKLEGRSRVDDIAMTRLLVLPEEEPRKIQRRNGYRLPHRMPVIVKPIRPDSGLEPSYSTFSADLSEGGVQTEFPKMIPLGTVFEVSFSLEIDKVEKIQLRAAVNRMLPPEEIGLQWRLGLCFLDCPEAVRRIIAKFIMMEQVARRMS